VLPPSALFTVDYFPLFSDTCIKVVSFFQCCKNAKSTVICASDSSLATKTGFNIFCDLNFFAAVAVVVVSLINRLSHFLLFLFTDGPLQ